MISTKITADVMKPEKETLEVECSLLHSPFGNVFYVCFTDRLHFSTSFDSLKEFVLHSSFARKYNLTFILK